MSLAFVSLDYDPDLDERNPLAVIEDWAVSSLRTRDIQTHNIITIRTRRSRFRPRRATFEPYQGAGGVDLHGWVLDACTKGGHLLCLIGHRPTDFLSTFVVDESRAAPDVLETPPWELGASPAALVRSFAQQYGRVTLIGHDAQLVLLIDAAGPPHAPGFTTTTNVFPAS